MVFFIIIGVILGPDKFPIDEAKRGESTSKQDREKDLEACGGSVLGDDGTVGELVILGEGGGAIFVGEAEGGETRIGTG